MSTLTTAKRIVFNRTDHDYSAYYDEQLIGIFPTFHAAEVALDDHALYLAEQGLIDAPLAALAEQSLRAACELPSMTDPTPLPEPDDLPTGNDPAPGRCPACNDLGPCWECGSIDLPAIGRALRHEMHDDRPALLRRLRATPERWHRLLAHAYVLEIGHTPSCDAQPAVPGVLWLWRELLRTAA